MEYNGYLGLLSIAQVQEKQIWKYNGQDVVVCDNGYKWLTILPKNEFYCITVMMDEHYSIKVCYIDIIDEQGIDEDGVPYFYDIYLDLVVYPDGKVIVDDMDELDQALRERDITQEQYNKALENAQKLQSGLLANKEAFDKFVKNRLKEVIN